MSSDKITLINASPEAVANHDKEAWLGLFTRDAEVHDPVGSRAHAGEQAISRFYDTFIAPNHIAFDVEHDVVDGDTVVRDLVIETTLSTGLQIGVPTHIRYELSEEDDQLKIRRLFAHWELRRMVWQTLATGWLGWATYAKLSVHMLKCQGLSGVLGFMSGFLGVGSRGKKHAENLLAAISRNDVLSARRYVENGHALSLGGMTWSQGDISDKPEGCADVADIARELQGLRWSKLTAAGRSVTATIHHGDRRGVAWFGFNARRRKRYGIVTGRFYFSE